MTDDKVYQEQRILLLAKNLKMLVEKNWWGIQLSELAQAMQLGEWETQHLFEEYLQKDPINLIHDVFNPGVTANQASLFDIWEEKVEVSFKQAEVEINYLPMDPSEISYEFYPHFLGQLCIASCDDGLVQVTFEDEDPGLKRLVKHFPKSKLIQQKTALHTLALEQLLTMYKSDFEPLVLPVCVKCSPFQEQVWQALLELSPRETTTYGALAIKMGDKNAARAVGTAIGLNPIALLIPCHRVVNPGTKLGHFRWGRWRKQILVGIEK